MDDNPHTTYSNCVEHSFEILSFLIGRTKPKINKYNEPNSQTHIFVIIALIPIFTLKIKQE